MVTPWLRGQSGLTVDKNAELRSLCVTDVMASSQPPAGGRGVSARTVHIVPASAASTQTPKVEDLMVTTVNADPWQYKPFDNTSATWQAAAQRRHQHRRRTNALLGIASVDLSGPHEPTPMVGAKIGQSPGHYFLALTINVDEGIKYKEQQTQTGDGEATLVEAALHLVTSLH